MQRLILYTTLYFLILSSCITPNIYNKLANEKDVLKSKLNDQEMSNLDLRSEAEELRAEINSLNDKIIRLTNDSVQNGGALIALQNKYNELSESYDLLVSKSSRDIANKAKQNKRILEQLEEVQTNLFAKEDELTKLSNDLADKKKELKLAQKNLEARSARVSELESIISKKDSMVSELKQSISKALIGLEGDGLSIEKRNGKIYVSLEEDLLFASGEYRVNEKGVVALKKLAVALSSQKELEILVEGHTDSIPLSGKGFLSDNWDLSVMRSTHVVKVLIKNSTLNPLQLTAAGRAEFSPISSNTTIEGRSANRRIEIILSPNLDDVFKLLEE